MPVTSERKTGFKSLNEGKLLELHAESLYVVAGYCLVLQCILHFMEIPDDAKMPSV